MSSHNPTRRLTEDSITAFYLPEPAVPPWPGRSILFRHLQDGDVAATSRGLVALGVSEADALRRLDALLHPPAESSSRTGRTSESA